MSIEKLLASNPVNQSPVDAFAGRLSSIVASQSVSDANIGKTAVSTEAFTEAGQVALKTVYNTIESGLKSIGKEVGFAVEGFQTEAASIAGILASNPVATFAAKLRSPNVDALSIEGMATDGSMTRPAYASEAYLEQDNRNSQLHSIMYNMLASRQDEFGETWFPTLVINPNETGVQIAVRLFYVYNDFKRSVTGSVANYGRKNIIRAYADASILKNEMTRVIPVVRATGGADDNSAAFVAASDVAPWAEQVTSDISVTTAPLKVGNSVDILGLSQTNELLNSGLMGPTDVLDTFIRLKQVFVKVTDGTHTDVFAINVEDRPGSTFTYSVGGNTKRMQLILDTDGIVLDATTLNQAGVQVPALGELATLKARVRLNITGSAVLDKGDFVVQKGQLALTTLRNASGVAVSSSNAQFISLANKLASAEIIGYTQTSYRANVNIRQRGQLFDSQTEYRILGIPYRSPLAVLAPATAGAAGMDESTAIQALVKGTGTRISNEAVTTLLNFAGVMASYSAVADANGELPEMAAFGHLYVKPTYMSESIDLAQVVDSRSSHERLADIRAALVEKIRLFAVELYRQSEYKAAAAVLTGNAETKPTIILGCGLTIYNYLMSDGDLRTLGEGFDLKIVPTMDSRFTDKIMMSFGVFDANRNTSVNPLNFGNMFWSPELTVVMPVSRDGQVSKELIVTPRYLHNPNLPVLASLTVSNLPAVINKVATNMHTV